ncbi:MULTISPECIES: twin-arginine translocase subunit TatC [unclassified Campylobacter]|uniref:twin-arginine translocase subunit TatC n=1 Tax=unclassified Campylobacter TaxID=2593542 RepID=UPI001DC0055E|nr:twin-arginine translocase subunit TatC [Campylobacter sp. RM12651]MBZ7983653.1 twin-arginine translocase subunit TatC [Campylobacter sp. RM12647]ULO03476.1 twin arginine translocation system, TatC protein [Campylobacter sp. RM12651]
MFEELKPHLVELRKRLFISVVALILAFFVCFVFWKPILHFICVPLMNVLPEGSEIIFYKPQENFFTAMQVSLFAAFLVALPIILWQAWKFVEPGLYENEKRFVVPFVFSATIMFLIGAAFCYYLVVPIAFDFLINFSGGEYKAMPSISEYVSFFTKLVIAFGLGYELPVAIFFLAKIGLVTEKTLIRNFRVAILIIFIFAAIMTPPDVFSQFLMAIPLIGLYAISIYIAKVVNPADPDIDSEDDEKELLEDKNA